MRVARARLCGPSEGASACGLPEPACVARPSKLTFTARQSQHAGARKASMWGPGEPAFGGPEGPGIVAGGESREAGRATG